MKIYARDMKWQLTTKHRNWNLGHNMQYNVKQNNKKNVDYYDQNDK